jgi:hypothetical protein
MSDNIIDFPIKGRDLVKEMTGPINTGCAVLIEGRVIQNLVMYDNGEEISFVLDGRFLFAVPREHAYQPANFAAVAMAIGAE